MEQALTDLVHLAERPLPDTGDGKYDYQVAPKKTTPTTGPNAVDIATHSSLSIFVSRIKALFGQGLPIDDPIKFIVCSHARKLERHVRAVQGFIGVPRDLRFQS